MTTTYTYNNLGQRVRKSGGTAGSTVVYVYDEQGKLLGEYDSAGTALREYVWLGSELAAVFEPDANPTNPPKVVYLHTDHLGAPRLAYDRSNQLRWRWIAEPFGTTAAEENPSALGAIMISLRLPGQVYDAESGLHYNYFRDYDPRIGRYVQSDPIGLAGGINTYAYVGGNPLSHTDPDGLQRLPGYSRPNYSGDAAGFHDPRGEFICEQWNCPNDPMSCSRNDMKRPIDFLPIAVLAVDAPCGCSCSRIGHRRDWTPPLPEERDLLDIYATYKEGKPTASRIWNSLQPLPMWYRLGGYGR